jgi:DNA polymerase I-like protein with 3'-5' exonuclease and polymerase domains
MSNIPNDVIVLDLETKVSKVKLAGKEEWDIDNSPYNPDNYCVSAHYLELDLMGRTPVKNLIWNHNDQDTVDERQCLQDALDRCDTIVCHNAKFDVAWLLEMEFDIPDRVWCTMIGEYIFARGQNVELSLEKTAIRRNVTHKKGELVNAMFKSGTGFEAMPLDTVIEYAEADVVSCADIFERQVDDLSVEANAGLWPTFDLMNEMLIFLVDIETNGANIDVDALDKVEEEFKTEKMQLIRDLEEIVADVMGDTPINLNSGIDLSKVLYSRELTDKRLHHQMFNIGTEPNGQKKYPPRMKKSEFNAAVRATSHVIHRTTVQHCFDCNGRGKEYKITKAGLPHKSPPKCKRCKGAGVVYQSNGVVAGLKLSPERPSDASFHGFATGKDVLPRMLAQAEKKKSWQTILFLKKMSRLNAVSSYLSTFVNGIRTWVREDGILHPNFNQAVTATSRLSCSKPNFQNLPKGGKFPVRKVIKSRFEGGTIVEADFSGLEFRVAGELSGDTQIISDVKNGKDIHKQTASIIHQLPETEVDKDTRQDSKKYSFAPLYGGQGANEAEHVRNYFKQFFVIYSGMAEWHKVLFTGVLKDGIVRVPSGREYLFPNVKRYGNGRVSHATKIVNYPVQGFATGDIVPLSCIRARRAFSEMKLQSKIILTVHDSLVVDQHPDEKDEVSAALTWAMRDMADEMKDRWDFTPVLTLDIEIEGGIDWMTMSGIDVPAVPDVPLDRLGWSKAA